MEVFTNHIETKNLEEAEMEDITPKVQKELSSCGLNEGNVTLFNIGSTGALSTMEYEPGLKKDIPIALEKLASSKSYYYHHETWHDDNGRGHVRAFLLGPSLVVPFKDGRLILGTWQQIVAINLDTHGRKRRIALQIMGFNF